MTIQTPTQKNNLATAYGTSSTHAAIYSTIPGAAAGTEIAREPIVWGTATNGVITATVVFDVPAGQTVKGAGVHGASTGSYLDGGAVTEQPFASDGTYTLTLTYTQQ